MLVRLGRLLNWIGNAVALVFLLIGIVVVVFGSGDWEHTLLGASFFGFGPAVLAWGVGRAARYVLAAE